MRLAIFNLLLLLGAGTARAQDHGATLCSRMSVRQDLEDCQRVVARRRVTRTAVDLCSRISTSADALSCARAVVDHTFDPGAQRVCARVSTNGDLLDCARAIADKTYETGELGQCSRYGTNGDLVRCLRNSGGRPVAYSPPPPARRRPHGASVVGTWRSTSGNTFTIPDSSTDFEVVKTLADGSERAYQARWVRGLVGVQFFYQHIEDGRAHTVIVTLQQDNPNTMRVESGGRVLWWVRV